MTAQMGRDIALLCPNHSARWGGFPPFCPRQEHQYPGEGQYGRILAKRKSLVPTEQRTPECSALSEWLYRLRYTGAT